MTPTEILTAHADSAVHAHNPLTDPVVLALFAFAALCYMIGLRIMRKASAESATPKPPAEKVEAANRALRNWASKKAGGRR